MFTQFMFSVLRIYVFWMFLSFFDAVICHHLLKIKHCVNSRATFVYILTSFVSVLLGHALHCQGNALFGSVHVQHLDPHNVADLEHLPRVLDKFIADL